LIVKRIRLPVRRDRRTGLLHPLRPPAQSALPAEQALEYIGDPTVEESEAVDASG
jgi:hypothetical protein